MFFHLMKLNAHHTHFSTLVQNKTCPSLFLAHYHLIILLLSGIVFEVTKLLFQDHFLSWYSLFIQFVMTNCCLKNIVCLQPFLFCRAMEFSFRLALFSYKIFIWYHFHSKAREIKIQDQKLFCFHPFSILNCILEHTKLCWLY